MQMRIGTGVCLTLPSCSSALGQAQPTCAPFKGWCSGRGPVPITVRPMRSSTPGLHRRGRQLVGFSTETATPDVLGPRGKLLLDFGNGDSPPLTVQHGTYTPAYTAFPGVGSGTASQDHRWDGLFLGASGAIVQEGLVTWIDGRLSWALQRRVRGNVCIKPM